MFEIEYLNGACMRVSELPFSENSVLDYGNIHEAWYSGALTLRVQDRLL